MNVLDGRLQREGSVATIAAGGATLHLSDKDAARLGELSRLRLGIRPQALRIVAPGAGLADGVLLLREALGFEDECLVELADGSQIKIVGRFSDALAENARIGLQAERADFYVFHPETARPSASASSPEAAGSRLDDYLAVDLPVVEEPHGLASVLEREALRVKHRLELAAFDEIEQRQRHRSATSRSSR